MARQEHWENQMGTDGFEFIEFTAPDVAELHALFERMGFRAVAHHRSKAVTLYRQGEINFIVNGQPDSPAQKFAAKHGPCACAMGFRVKDAAAAYKRALSMGAKPFESDIRPMELAIPAIEGVGGSAIYLIDRYGDRTIYDVDFVPTDPNKGWRHEGAGLALIDHVTHNVHRGNMDALAKFYEKVFNFRQIRYFDIEGKLTGLKSRAMTSPCGRIRIPINESADDKSQIEEFIHDFRGEGIQHIALSTPRIFDTVEGLRERGITFQDTPDTYYEMIDKRVPGHGESIALLRKDRILIDGAPEEGEGLLLQIFTKNAIGPAFFEIIQRKGNEGFGEGNFRALFESIEADQIRRGVLKAS
ncbi:MAG: 4-hydroxyphenylpyruvate dioxygenase [Alphaproteobacteria bacterium]